MIVPVERHALGTALNRIRCMTLWHVVQHALGATLVMEEQWLVVGEGIEVVTILIHQQQEKYTCAKRSCIQINDQ